MKLTEIREGYITLKFGSTHGIDLLMEAGMTADAAYELLSLWIDDATQNGTYHLDISQQDVSR